MPGWSSVAHQIRLLREQGGGLIASSTALAEQLNGMDIGTDTAELDSLVATFPATGPFEVSFESVVEPTPGANSDDFFTAQATLEIGAPDVALDDGDDLAFTQIEIPMAVAQDGGPQRLSLRTVIDIAPGTYKLRVKGFASHDAILLCNAGDAVGQSERGQQVYAMWVRRA